MSKALQTRVHRQLVSLIESGSAYNVANLTSRYQGVGVAGLNWGKPKTTFEIVFTSHPDFLQTHEKQADINMLIATPTLLLSDESDEGMRLIRHIEALAELPEEQRWSTRVANGASDDEDEGDVWLENWLSCLMDDSPAVDRWVRQALIDTIDEELLADIECSIELELEQIAHQRYIEA